MIGLLKARKRHQHLQEQHHLQQPKPGTRPSRPSVVPSKRPSEEDAPLAELKHEGPESSIKDISDRVFNVLGEDEAKKLIK
jgi:hypothetical protein